MNKLLLFLLIFLSTTSSLSAMEKEEKRETTVIVASSSKSLLEQGMWKLGFKPKGKSWVQHSSACKPKKGVELLEQSSNENNVEATKKLAKIFSKGLYGIKKDIDKAAKYSERAHDLGDQFAQKMLDALDQEGSLKATVALGKIFEKSNNIPQAIKYFEKAAEKENGDALFSLGYIYHEFEKDIEKAQQY